MKDDEYVINEVFYTYYKYSECNHERSYQEERYFTKPTQEQIRTFKSLKPFQKYDPIRNRVEINGDCIAASILIMFLVVVVIFISLLISSVLL